MYVMFRFSLQWFGIGWVVIALAECTTIRVICGIPWQVNPNGWPCQGPLHVTPPIGIISLEAIALGAISVGAKFHWDKIPLGEITLEQISRAPRAMAGLHSWRRRHLVCLAAWRRRLHACLAASMAGDPQRLATAGTTA